MKVQLSQKIKNLILKFHDRESLDKNSPFLHNGKDSVNYTPFSWRWIPEIQDDKIVITPIRIPENILDNQKNEGFEVMKDLILYGLHDLGGIYAQLENLENKENIIEYYDDTKI